MPTSRCTLALTWCNPHKLQYGEPSGSCCRGSTSPIFFICTWHPANLDFKPMNGLQAWRVLALLILGAVRARQIPSGRDPHWMMFTEAGTTVLPPQITHKEPKIWRFSLKAWKFRSICLNIHAPFKQPLISCSQTVQTDARAVGDTTGAWVPHFLEDKNRLVMYQLCKGLPGVVLCAGTSLWRCGRHAGHGSGRTRRGGQGGWRR